MEVIETQSSATSFVSFVDIDDLDLLAKGWFIKEMIEAGEMALMSL